MDQSIPLSQKLYLLGIHPEKGGLVTGAYSAMNYVLPGALLLELFLNRNIRFEEKLVIFLNDKTSDPVYRFILGKINQKPVPVKISTLLSKLTFSQKLIRQHVQQGLVEKRIIMMEPHRFLFFKWKKSKILNRSLVFQMVSEIEGHIFRGTENEEVILLLSMLKPAGLLNRLFRDREKRKRAADRLKKLKENQVSVAVTEAINAAQAVAASVAISVAVSRAGR
jgi:hypothetical protein